MDLAEYRALLAKVDAFFERVRARHAERMACASGCSGCCGHALTLSPVEAESVRAHVASLPPEARAALAARRARRSPCPALDDAGRCGIYAARPLICRTQGLPMRVSNSALPVLEQPAGLPAGGGPGAKLLETAFAADEDGLSVCPLNFDGVPLRTLERDAILEVETLDATLAVVNARAVGKERALDRVPIGDLLGP